MYIDTRIQTKAKCVRKLPDLLSSYFFHYSCAHFDFSLILVIIVVASAAAVAVVVLLLLLLSSLWCFSIGFCKFKLEICAVTK